jgi:hypothetical protein
MRNFHFPGDDLLDLFGGQWLAFESGEFATPVGGELDQVKTLGQPFINNSTVLSSGIVLYPNYGIRFESEMASHLVGKLYRIVRDTSTGVHHELSRDHNALAIWSFVHFKIAPSRIAKSVIGSPNHGFAPQFRRWLPQRCQSPFE